MARARVTFSDGRTATLEGTREQIEAAVEQIELEIETAAQTKERVQAAAPSDRQAERLAAARSRLEGQPTFQSTRTPDQYMSQEDTAQVGQKVGVVARGLAQGTADVVDMLASPATGAAYGVGRAAGVISPETSYFGDEGFFDASGTVGRAMGDVGVPQTEDEQRLNNYSRVIGGAVGGIGIGKTIAKFGLTRVGAFLSDQPWLQVAGAVTGEGAREAAEASGMGQWGQLAAALTGSMAPGLLQGAFRRFGFGSKDDIDQVLKDLDAAGQLDTLLLELEDVRLKEFMLNRIGKESADVKEAGRISGAAPGGLMEGLLRRLPGAAGRLAKMNDNLERRVGVALAHRARELSDDAQSSLGRAEWERLVTERGLDPKDVAAAEVNIREAYEIPEVLDVRKEQIQAGPDAAEAGAAIERGINAYAESFRARTKAAYEKINELIPSTTNASAEKTLSFLRGEVADNKFAEVLGSKQLRALLDTLEENSDDVGGGVLTTYGTLVTLRKQVGKRLGNPSLTDDATRGQWKALYKAITEDMMTAAKQVDENIERTAAMNIPEVSSKFSPEHSALVSMVERLGLRGVGRDDSAGILRALRENADLAAREAEILRDEGAEALVAFRAQQVKDAKAIMQSLDDSMKKHVKDVQAQKRQRKLLEDQKAEAQKRLEGKSVTQQIAETNQAYAQGIATLDGALAFVTRKMENQGTSPEQLFDAVMSNAKNAPSRIVALKQALQEGNGNAADNWKLVQAAVIDHLGTPRPSEATGGIGGFSLETFLTRWEGIKPASRSALFGDAQLRKELDALAALAARSRKTRQSVKGAGPKEILTGGGLLGIGTAIAGGPVLGTALGMLAALGGANGLARFMTNPRAIRWMAQSYGKDWNQGAAILSQLASLADREPELAEDIAEILSGTGTALHSAEDER